MRKKVLLYGLCAALLLSLTACRKSQVEPQPDEQEPPEIEAVTPEPEPEPEPEPPETAEPGQVPDTETAVPAEDDDPQERADSVAQEQAETAPPETAELEPVSEPAKTETPKQTQQTEPKKTASPAPTETAPAETEQTATTDSSDSDLGVAGWKQSPDGTWYLGTKHSDASASDTPQPTGPKSSDHVLTAEQEDRMREASARVNRGEQKLIWDEEGGWYYEY